MAVELGVAYLSLAASTGTLSKDVRNALGGVESSVDQTGKKSGASLGGGLKKGLGLGIKMLGGLALGVGALAAKGGITRALAIEGAEKKLEGLGHSTKAIEAIMGNALASVKGTAYGLGDAATVAAGLVASGVKHGKQLTGVLKTVADTATISGRSLTDIGTIFGSVAARGKLQGDDMLQLMSAGVPVLQFLAKQLGVTSAEASKMVSQGKIDFATFAAAMQKGLGGAALKGGETFKGALSNVYAALGRLGALGAIPALASLKTVFNATTPAIDALTERLKPLAESLGPQMESATKAGLAKIGPAFAAVAAGVKGFLPQIQGIVSQITAGIDFGQLIQAGGAIIAAISPVGTVFKALAPLLPQIADAFAQLANQGLAILVPLLSQVAPLFAQLSTTLVTAGTQIGAALIPVLLELATAILPVIGQVIAAVVPVVTQLVQAFLPLVGMVSQLVTALLPPLATALTSVLDALAPVWIAVTKFVSALMPLVGIAVQLVGTLIPPLIAVIQALLPPIVAVVTAVAGALVPVWESVIQVVQALMPVISGLAGVIGSIVGAVAPVVAIVAGGLIRVIATLITWVAQALAGIIRFVAGGITQMARFASTVASKIGEAIKWFSDLPGRAVRAIGNVGSLLVGAGRSLVNGFLSGIKSAWDSLVGWVKSGMDRLRGLWPFSPAKWGPFSGRGYVTHSGKAMTDDFASSLRGGMPSVQAAAADVMKAASMSWRGSFDAEDVQPAATVADLRDMFDGIRLQLDGTSRLADSMAARFITASL